jgi:hypothetical protein
LGTLVCNCFVVEAGSKPREIVIAFKGEEPDGLAELLAEHGDRITVVEAKGFEAFDFTTQLLVVLGPPAVIQLGGLIKTHLESNRHVQIKADGVEITGVSPDKAVEVLEKIRSGTDPDA